MLGIECSSITNYIICACTCIYTYISVVFGVNLLVAIWFKLHFSEKCSGMFVYHYSVSNNNYVTLVMLILLWSGFCYLSVSVCVCV